MAIAEARTIAEVRGQIAEVKPYGSNGIGDSQVFTLTSDL
jgi:hypothetical protein